MIQNFHPIEDLLYYDGPILSHYKSIERITLTVSARLEEDEGDMFDGTIEMWRDAFFDNFTVHAAIEFAKQHDATIKFYGRDFLVAWYDVRMTGEMRFIPEIGKEIEHQEYLWHVFAITPENLMKLMSKQSSGNAITLKEAMAASTEFYRTDDTRLYSQDDTLTGDPIAFTDIADEFLPTDDAYVMYEPSAEEPITSAEPVSPSSPGEAVRPS